MLKRLKYWKDITGTGSSLQAFRKILRAGENTLEVGADVKELKERHDAMQEEHLEMAQMLHEYETKLLNLERRAYEAEEKSKKLELAHVAVARENHWMKQELLDQKKQRRRQRLRD